MTRSDHPSFLQLDRHALGETDDLAIGEHVEQCDQCSAHVKRVQVTLPLPEWARSLEKGREEQVNGVLGWMRWDRASLWMLGSVAVVASIVLLAQVPQAFEGGSTETTTVRGAPAVALHLKRGTRVRLWSPGFLVHPGDQLRVEVAPDGYSRVAVFRMGEARALIRLYEGEVAPRASTVLPPAWELDDEPGSETLIVAFGKAPIDGESVRRALRDIDSGETDGGVWIRRIALEKSPEEGISHEQP